MVHRTPCGRYDSEENALFALYGGLIGSENQCGRYDFKNKRQKSAHGREKKGGSNSGRNLPQNDRNHLLTFCALLLRFRGHSGTSPHFPHRYAAPSARSQTTTLLSRMHLSPLSVSHVGLAQRTDACFRDPGPCGCTFRPSLPRVCLRHVT